MTEWNPDLYLKFRRERTLPAHDLLSLIDLKNPSKILDVGCGPGNATILLAERWPKASITGIDASAEMIAKARQDYPQVTWLIRDAAGDLSDLTRFDLVFSNAALQWMPNHEVLLPNIFGLLGKGGVLAVQVPNNYDSPVHLAIRKVTDSPKWREYLTADIHHYYDSAATYYRQLTPLTPNLKLWETIYYHVMDSLEDIREWYRGTHLRFYLGQLPEDKKNEFENEIRELIADHFQPQPDGKILFPFRRLFFIATKD